MKHGSGLISLCVVAVACLSLCATQGLTQESKSVLGPTNLPLQDGANALKAGKAEEGVRLTLIGLQQAKDARERQAANSNLCAGYALLEQYQLALSYCNAVLEKNDRHWRSYSNRALIFVKLQRFEEAQQDLLRGEALRPHANSLKAVRRMYRDATDPVSPNIIIDDRRTAPDDDNE